jgi:hypothetical protein
MHHFCKDLIAVVLSGGVVACGRGSSSDSDYGVTPWAGPPVAFQGLWEASEVSDETGSVVPNSGANITVILDGPTGAPLDVTVQADGDPCLRILNGNTPTEVTMTSDGHGFDGTAGSQKVPVHARVDPSGVMHVELDTSGTTELSPNITVEATCRENFLFNATKELGDGGSS